MAEQPDHHLRRALEAQPDHHLGTDAAPAQMMRQLVGARIELAIAQRSRPRTPPRSHPGVRAACAANSSGSVAGGDRTARCRSSPAASSRARPAPECRARRSPAPDRQPPPPAAGRAAPPAPPRSARSNRSVAYSITPAIPAGVPSAARSLAQAHRQVELGARRRHRLEARRKPGKLELDRRVVLQRQHHLEQRMTRQRARRVEHLHQPLERKILVAVGRKIARPHPRRSARGSSDCPTCRCAAPAC